MSGLWEHLGDIKNMVQGLFILSGLGKSKECLKGSESVAWERDIWASLVKMLLAPDE